MAANDDIKWDDEDIKWDPSPIKTYGPVNPYMSSANSSPEEMANNARMAADAKIPFVSGNAPKPTPSTDDIRRRMKAGPVPFDEAVGATESDLEQITKGLGAGALQGVTLGWADELKAALDSGSISTQQYKELRDKTRDEYAERQKNAPISTAAGNVIGGGAYGAALPAMGAIGATALGAGLGAVQGAGQSQYEDTSGVVQDALIGGAIGGGTALGGSLLVGGKAADAAARTDRRIVDALGFKGTRTHKNNIALQGRRLANESPELAAAGDDIDEALADALAEVNAATPGSEPLSMRDIAKAGAKQAKDTDANAVKALADYARKTGIDPYSRGFDGTQTLGAAKAVEKATGSRIGEIRDAVNAKTGGVSTQQELAAELLPLLEKYDRQPGAVARSRAETIAKILDDYNRIYPPLPVKQGGAFAAPPIGGPRVPVSDLAATKSDIAKSAFVGNAGANPGIAKQGEQELATALKSVLDKHVTNAGQVHPELQPMVAELPELNKQFGFAKAVGAAADYRALADVSGQKTLLDNLRMGGAFGGTVGKIKDGFAWSAQQRDKAISYLMNLGESESEAKRIVAKVAERTIRGAPQAGRAGAVDVQDRIRNPRASKQENTKAESGEEENLNASHPIEF